MKRRSHSRAMTYGSYDVDHYILNERMTRGFFDVQVGDTHKKFRKLDQARKLVANNIDRAVRLPDAQYKPGKANDGGVLVERKYVIEPKLGRKTAIDTTAKEIGRFVVKLFRGEEVLIDRHTLDIYAKQ